MQQLKKTAIEAKAEESKKSYW